MTDDRLMEIFTRAVAGRAGRRLTWAHTIPAGDVKNVLGVHLGNTTLSVNDQGGKTSVDITVHCDIWCRDQKETMVIQTTAQSVFDVDLPTTGQIVGEREIQASLADSPRSTGIKVTEGQLMLNLEVDISLEVVGQIRVWVRTADGTGVVDGVSVPVSALEEPPKEDPQEHDPYRDKGRSRSR